MMKRIPVSSILPGTTVWHECYNDRGELLIAPGTIVTQHLIDQLRKRNVLELLLLVPQEPKPAAAPAQGRELEMLPGHREAHTDKEPDSDSGEGPGQQDVAEHRFAAEFDRLRREDLGQLLHAPVARQLDLSIRRGHNLDRPVGVSFNSSMHEASPFARTREYKNEVLDIYERMLETIRDFMDALLRGRAVDVSPLRRITDHLLKVFAEDPDIVISLAYVKDRDDDYLYGHMVNTCLLSMCIGASAGYNREQVLTIGIGALLHDIGMPLVPVEIRNKSTKLSSREFGEIQKHPVMGIMILNKIRHLPEAVRYMLYQSHERENGTGYPQQRGGRLIHRFAKIIQIADVFEALTSPRKHRAAYTPFEALEMVIRMSQRGLLSRHFVKAFVAYTSLFPVGSIVELSDHRLARVIHSNIHMVHRPIVSIVCTESSRILDDTDVYQVDLAFDDSIAVIRALSPGHLDGVDIMRGF